jgi:hypothetical protein
MLYKKSLLVFTFNYRAAFKSMTAIYHITHIRNLPLILESGCLWCDAERLKQGLSCIGIAHDHIKQRRARRIVPIGCGGTLTDYVPFYFAPRSPMLYAIHTNSVIDYAEGQANIIHLVSSVEIVDASKLTFAFTNGHAEMAVSKFYNSTENLDKIDWSIIKSRVWKDTATDNNRKWRRQVEFLVYKAFPIKLIDEIGVYSKEIAGQVSKTLKLTTHQINVTLRRNWYY